MGVRLFQILILLAFAASVVSCGKKEVYYRIQPSVLELKFAGEGGAMDVDFPDGDWCISRVTIVDANMPVFGNIYDQSGKQIGNSTPLKLDGLGRIESLWEDHGFVITRSSPLSLHVASKENCMSNPFTFVIELQSGDVYEKVTVRQAPTSGYHIDKIDYFVGENHRDSLYTRRETGYNYTVRDSSEITVFPLFNARHESYFESDDTDAFRWTDADSVKVGVPVDIVDGKVIVGSPELIYNSRQQNRPTGFERVEHVVHIGPGTTLIKIFSHYRIREVQYTLTLRNIKTNAVRTATGRWVEQKPLGTFDVYIEPSQSNNNTQ